MIRTVLILAGIVGVVPASAAQQPQTAAVSTTVANPAQRSAPERAWDDLRWLATALEAYSSDNDSLYSTGQGPRDGVVADLDQQLEWYYSNTFPSKPAPPHVDPWGRPYHFVISGTRKLYALYSLGPDGKLDNLAEQFVRKLTKDQLSDVELKDQQASGNVIVSSGTLLFAPPEVLRTLKPAT